MQLESYEAIFKSLTSDEVQLLYLAYNRGGACSWDYVDLVNYDQPYRSLVSRRLIIPCHDPDEGFILLPKGEGVIEEGSPTACGLCGQEVYFSEASVDASGDVILCQHCDETFYDDSGHFIADRN